MSKPDAVPLRQLARQGLGEVACRRYTHNMQFTARIWSEEGGFVAECVELKVVSQGDTADEALSNLREAVMGFLECADPVEVRERMHVGMQIRTFDVAV
jgi:predicted RNase H-like HicB family nuclease